MLGCRACCFQRVKVKSRSGIWSRKGRSPAAEVGVGTGAIGLQSDYFLKMQQCFIATLEKVGKVTVSNIIIVSDSESMSPKRAAIVPVLCLLARAPAQQPKHNRGTAT
jgi:hypothetical protein